MGMAGRTVRGHLRGRMRIPILFPIAQCSERCSPLDTRATRARPIPPNSSTDRSTRIRWRRAQLIRAGPRPPTGQDRGPAGLRACRFAARVARAIRSVGRPGLKPGCIFRPGPPIRASPGPGRVALPSPVGAVTRRPARVALAARGRRRKTPFHRRGCRTRARTAGPTAAARRSSAPR